MYVLDSRRFPFRHSLVAHLVQELDDDVVLLHTQPVEVFPDHVGQLVLSLSAELFASCNRR